MVSTFEKGQVSDRIKHKIINAFHHELDDRHEDKLSSPKCSQFVYLTPVSYTCFSFFMNIHLHACDR